MKNQQEKKDPDAVSALADGQLRGAEFARTVTQTWMEPETRAQWHAYHVVGDVLRAGELGDCGGDVAFVNRFRLRLEQEIAAAGALTPVSPIAPEFIANSPVSALANAAFSSNTVSANDARFRWKLMAGVASMAAVAAIGWNLLGGSGQGDAARQLASADQSPVATQPAAPQTPAEQNVMIRDPHLDALMAAHKQFGGTSALQMPAGFLRNATFEQGVRP